MPLILPGNVASATAATTYSVANSCRFNAADSPKLTKTPGSAGNQKRWTYSFWIKRQNAAVEDYVLYATDGDGSNKTHVTFAADGRFRLYNTVSGSTSNNFRSSREFKDPAAWYHIVVVWDTGNATEADRCQLWVNGVRETAFDDETLNDENSTINDDVEHTVSGTPTYIDGYMAEVCFIDGTVYTAPDFGEFDEDSPNIWKPKDVSGLTFGTNGFYLDFEDSANLGNDANGGTDLSETNIAAVDQATDTPTNNFCVLGGGTMNPQGFSGAVMTQGGLNIKSDSGDYSSCATMAMTAGKWYWEVKNVSSVDQGRKVGIVRADHISIVSSQGFHIGATYDNVMSALNGADGVIYQTHLNGGGYAGTFTDSNVDGGTTLDGTEIVGIALDADNGTIKFFINNTEVNNSPVTLTNWATDFKPFGALPAARGDGGGLKQEWGFNFGGCPPFALSSAAADGNGYGAFEYAPPSGYLALCSKNLGSDGG